MTKCGETMAKHGDISKLMPKEVIRAFPTRKIPTKFSEVMGSTAHFRKSPISFLTNILNNS